MSEAVQTDTDKWYKDYYSRKGEDRNDILRNHGVLFQILATQKSVIEALRTLPARRDWKVLDVGCGAAGSLLQFLGFGFSANSLHGIDVIPERIHEAKERFPNLNLVCGDATQMEYSSNYFEFVMESTMFIQLRDDNMSQKIADEMLRVLKPGGYIMLVDWRHSYGHPEYKALSRGRINKLFKIGTQTKFHCIKPGALLPPIGRPLSTYLPSIYFLVQRLLPFCVGQVTTVLQKSA